MAFIDTSETILGIEVAQIDSRYVAPGQPVEVTFKFLPGEVHTGKVVAVIQAIADRPGPGLGQRRRRPGSSPRRPSWSG